MPTILLTGANRGIGKALAETYVADGWDVIGTCRDTSNVNIKGVQFYPLEVTEEDSIEQLKQVLAGHPIDILWNNAGVYLDRGKKLDQLTNKQWLETFHINTIAPIRLASAFMGNVEKSERKVMAFTSSQMGSITRNGGGAYAYRSSKSALNMAVNCLSQEVEASGTSCVVLHPGWVQTDMGGSEADITVETSAMGMKNVVDPIGPERQNSYNGLFFNYDGSQIPW
ncbi:SDR family oxidoreductase [Curvivirga aplysinae]|uniref:SDR family oxidoreductase n=1 Tax=Curvivirga aplysinae TaxID=2529852 RepID=UPI0012BB7AA5|nr:SDR family oxidoreductase [Curvivirga aplysinae]MTI09194.1 SDR family oxidoreductase [Curvivirga aplysinae]